MRITAILILTMSIGASSAHAEPDTFTISAVGDVMMGTTYPANNLRADGGRRLFAHSKEYFMASDLRFANLEGPLYDGDKAADGKSEGSNRYLFRTPTSYASWLADAGINVVSLANNHAMDFGAAGLRSTKQALRSAGIQFSAKSRSDIASFNVRGIRIALIAVDYYTGERSMTSPRATFEEIKRLKRAYDVVIVSAHAGAEGARALRTRAGSEFYMGELRGDPVKFSHAAVDAGADLILMHGPHVPRAMEIYSERLVVYSLGNFITERGIDIQGVAGLAPLLRAQIRSDGRFVKGDITSFRQTREASTVYDATGASALKIKELSELDFPQSMPHFDGSSGRFFP